MPGQQDTVHSYRPTLPITYQYHLKPGESFYKDRNGKVTIVRSRNEQVSKDTRNNWQKKQDSKNAPNMRKQKQMTQAEHKTAIDKLMQIILPISQKLILRKQSM